MTIIAASSGNTGAAVAMMAAMRGYKVPNDSRPTPPVNVAGIQAIVTTNKKCSDEKMNAIKAYGSILLCPVDRVLKWWQVPS